MRRWPPSSSMPTPHGLPTMGHAEGTPKNPGSTELRLKAARLTWAFAAAGRARLEVLKPVNPSIPATFTPVRQAWGRLASQALNAALDRPSTMSSSRAGPVPTRIGVRSMITMTYLSPFLVWRHTCSSTPIAATPSNRAASSMSTRRPSARTASFVVFHATASPSATRATLRC